MSPEWKRYKHKINFYRRYWQWKKASCIYIHIPKAAGTSINKAIYGKTLGHYTAEEIKKTFPHLFERSFTFSFVRNPWDRTLSAYRFAKVGRTESMGVYNPRQYEIPEFDSFEKFLFEWLSKKEPKEIDYIFQPQHEFVCDKNNDLLVDYIGKVETLKEDIVNIEKRLSRNVVIGRENSTSGNEDYREYYKNRDMVNVVGEIYKRDIKLFGYNFNQV